MEERSGTGKRFLLQVACKAPRRQTCCQSAVTSPPHTHIISQHWSPALTQPWADIHKDTSNLGVEETHDLDWILSVVTVASLLGSHVHCLPVFPGLNLLCKPVSQAEDGKVHVPWRHSCENPSSTLSTTAESRWQDALAGEHEKWASQSLPTTLHKPNLVLLTGFSLQVKPQICTLCFHSTDRSPPFYPSTTIRRDFPDLTGRAISSSRLSTCYQEMNYFLQWLIVSLSLSTLLVSVSIKSMLCKHLLDKIVNVRCQLTRFETTWETHLCLCHWLSRGLWLCREDSSWMWGAPSCELSFWTD